jgi:hypothetical protein
MQTAGSVLGGDHDDRGDAVDARRGAEDFRAAYRFAGITLAIIRLIGRDRAPWVAAIHRFVEVSIGIAVGLVITALWPEREAPQSA